MLLVLSALNFSSAAEDDLYDVLGEIIDLKGKWADVLAGLRLPPSQRSTIKTEQSTDARSCLEAVLVAWLSKTYNIEKHGHPSWRTLVKAVADPIGGANVALALKIAEKHPGKVYIYARSLECGVSCGVSWVRIPPEVAH